ncbi:MAG: YdcH family protein [Acetobacteraceae bacterium]|nr:YdcH family protein [Acetobacteraceae bacterium]
MLQSPRLRSLEERHANLERQITQEDARPRPDELEIARLKREKLRVKEEIERLRRERD